MQQFHVYYRTQGMAHRNENGWKRADVMAPDAHEALHQIASKKRLIFARVYPGAVCTAWRVEWSPEYLIRHEPHSTTGEEEE